MKEPVNLQEAMYQIYKDQRDFILLVREQKMNYEEFLFLQNIHGFCEKFDTLNPDFFEKWIAEHGHDKKLDNK